MVLRLGYLGLVAIGCCQKYQRSVRVNQAASAVISGLSCVDELVWALCAEAEGRRWPRALFCFAAPQIYAHIDPY